MLSLTVLINVSRLPERERDYLRIEEIKGLADRMSQLSPPQLAGKGGNNGEEADTVQSFKP